MLHICYIGIRIFAPAQERIFDLTDNGITFDDKLNATDDISVESILAEYGDFGLGVPPEDEVSAARGASSWRP